MSTGDTEFIVELSSAGERLDLFIVAKLPELSRTSVQRLVKEGNIRVNDAAVKPNHHLRVDEKVSVTIPAPRVMEVKAESIPLDVLYEDDDLLVLNKTAGMTVHPGAGNFQHTLVHALLHHCEGSLSGIGGELRPGIVHRLDKDTSGCLVVAKNDVAHLSLSKQFQERETSKVYLALVTGVMRRDRGVIDAGIARHKVHRKKMTVDEIRGRHAVTDYHVMERFTNYTLVEAIIHTGRTHQIRVHLSWLGHPVVGDTTYGRRTQVLSHDKKTLTNVSRQMLHAWRLGFNHPRTGKRMEFESPIPKDMKELLALLRQKPD